MNTIRACVWAVVLAASSVGQDSTAAPPGAAAAPPRILVGFADGRMGVVSLLDRTGDNFRLRSNLFDGYVEFVASIDDFTPGSRYRLSLAHRQPTTHAEHLALAERTAAWRLIEPTAHHLREAIAQASGPEAASLQAEVRNWAIDWIESIVRESLAAGDVAEAGRRLGMMCSRLADGCAEDRIERLAGEIDAARSARDSARAKQRQQRLAEQARAEIERRMQPIQRRIETGDARMREALRNSRRTVQTTRLAEQALEQWRAAWDAARQLQSRFPDDAALATEIAALGEDLRERSVRASLHAANALTIQSDFRSAIEWVDRVVDLDPDNADARELRRTIQFASAAAGGWGWGMGWGPTRN
jgi:tetratricopeptide (TPR) repeat protein